MNRLTDEELDAAVADVIVALRTPLTVAEILRVADRRRRRLRRVCWGLLAVWATIIGAAGATVIYLN